VGSVRSPVGGTEDQQSCRLVLSPDVEQQFSAPPPNALTYRMLAATYRRARELLVANTCLKAEQGLLHTFRCLFSNNLAMGGRAGWAETARRNLLFTLGVERVPAQAGDHVVL